MWFGVAAVVVAIVVPIVVLLTIVVPQFGAEAQYVPADRAPHELTVPSNSRIGLFTVDRTGPIPCSVTDSSGAQVPVEWMENSSVTVNEWTATRTFDSGDGRIVVTCADAVSAEDRVRVAEMPDAGLLVGGILGSIAFGLVFLAVGIVLIIVTLVRRAR
ncbi:hypothetical protein [Tsukamurella sp. 1534]|uniref:hypothetical protein n=1 Tax=Tsukamurella sp. 1534 TaxID=1151061 RepID=UPI00031C4DBE|nr:hypothetical protein [Tsukamurella sp. 1534]